MCRGSRMVTFTGLLASIVIGVLSAGDARPQQEQRIEIVIQDSQFLLSQPASMELGVPTVIVLRNEDIIEHGFTSNILSGIMIRAQGEGMTVYGKGIEGFHIKPGSTLVVRFTPQHAGEHHFHCDLHPEMKGEFFILELGKV